MGFRFNCFTMRSLITITKAAPSEVCDEFPAVTEPPMANTGLNLDNPSTVVSVRIPSSVATTNSRVFFFMFSSTYVSFTVIGTTSSLNLPSFQAAAAFMCDSYEN
jgi:hypothetical protein